jgi:spore coat assembly protein SafA
MRYKTFIWPHNPKTYTITYERKMAVNKVPFGRYYLQDMGLTRRVMRGEGEFVGEGAYDKFKELATLFYDNSPGLLVHPVWQVAKAYFVGLTLEQEPRADYVRYTFAFWECCDQYDPAGKTVAAEQSEETAAAPEKQWHQVAQGESLWAIAVKYGVALSELIALNPQIKNPNLIYVGQKVRVA